MRATTSRRHAFEVLLLQRPGATTVHPPAPVEGLRAIGYQDSRPVTDTAVSHAAVIYQQYRFQSARLGPGQRIGVLDAVAGELRDEIMAELQAAFPGTDVLSIDGRGTAAVDLLVLPFTRRLHRRIVRDKGRLVLRALRVPSRTVVFYDVAHRRSDIVARQGLLSWYARRVGEALVIAAARRVRWRPS